MELLNDIDYIDTFSDETKESLQGTKLWKPWMGAIRLHQCRSLDELHEFLRRHQQYQELCWDIETKSFFPDPSEIVGHSIAFTKDEGMYVPVRHQVRPEANLDPDVVFSMIMRAVEPPRILTVYNARFECRYTKEAGFERSTSFDVLHDGLLIRWLYCSDDKKLNLKDSCFELVGHEMLEIREVPGAARDNRKRGKVDFSYTDPREATVYAAADVVMTLAVQEKTLPRVLETGQQMILELEHRLVGALINMEYSRVRIDRAVLQCGQKDLLHWAEVVATELYQMNGGPFNILSAAEAASFLKAQGVLLPPTETGLPSTDKRVLDMISPQFPVVKKISQYRSLLKEVGTYCHTLLAHTSEDNPGGVFNLIQHAGTTGRMGSRKGEIGDPRFLPLNSQSIPSSDAYETAACRRVLNPPLEEMKAELFYGGNFSYEPQQKSKPKEVVTETLKPVTITLDDLLALDDDPVVPSEIRPDDTD